MAKNVTAQVLGGASTPNLEVGTVQDLKDQLELTGEYTASVNGEPVDMDYVLEDYEFCSFAPAVKGGK